MSTLNRPGTPTNVENTMRYLIPFLLLPLSPGLSPAAEFQAAVEPMRGALSIGAVAADSRQVSQYGRLELTVDLGASYDNPYDPEDVSLDAVFTSPSGRRLAVPGFFLVEHHREVREERETMVSLDERAWRIRFTSTEIGRYTWQLKLRDRTGEVTGGEGAFESVKGSAPGFIRQSKADPHYLAFDNGQGYFAIGHNLPIYHTTGQLGLDAMRKFAAAGENHNRWWMSSSGFGIEWMDRLGWYRQDVAARIDLSLDLARELGLYYMMCMDTHQDFRERGWERNPFNRANGGPCGTPSDWFTDPAARKFYKKRLRYTVARWGYSPNVFCWEFGNEFEGWAGASDEIKLAWHKEMSDYLRSIDPFGHLITTSFWSQTGPEEFWNLENIDVVQTHCYTNDDGNVAEAVRRYCLQQWERFDKPHIFGEFGIRSHSTTADKDPEGWAIHNGLWAGLASFCTGGPMPWWHERYIDKLDLYFHFTAIANFTGDLPLGTARWEPLDTDAPEFVDKTRPPETRDAVILALSRWGKPENDRFVIPRDGRVADDRLPQKLLHGSGHQDIKAPPTFVVEYPQAGRFVVHVNKVSNSGLLKIWIDGELALERELPCGEGLGKESVYREEWTLWETTYDEEISVAVPPGKHEVRVENLGKDWVDVAKYAFTGCKIVDHPDVLVCAMKTDRLAILWLQNRRSSWYNHAGNGTVGRVAPFELVARGLADGKYRIEWWETWKGAMQRAEEAEVRDGRLKIVAPALETDVALKIHAL
jgi:hypothetical protein